MNEDFAVFPLMLDWNIEWATSGTYGESDDEGPVLHAFIATRSRSLELLLRVNVSQQQMVNELLGLLQGINEGLLDALDQEFPPDPRGGKHLGGY